MKESVHRFHRQLGTTRTWGYGGEQYGGPTIQATSGTPVSYTARNALGDTSARRRQGAGRGEHAGAWTTRLHPRTSLHLHGGYTESASDGTPNQTYMPG